MLRRPRQAPLSRLKGATPTRAAICRRERVPSSGSSASRVALAVGPMPGMLWSQTARTRRAASAWRAAAIWASRASQALGEPGQVSVDVGPDHGRGQRAPLLLGDPSRQELAPAGDQGVQFLTGGRGARAERRLDLGREARQHLRVHVVRLGQDVAAAGEVAHLARIAHDHRQPGGMQRRIHGALVAAGGFQHQAGGVVGLGPADQAGVARRRVGHAPALIGRIDRHLQVVARDIDTETHRVGHSGTLRGTLASRPALYLRARVSGPGNCSGSEPA